MYLRNHPMAKTDRLFRLLHLIRGLRPPVTAARLAAAMEVSERTIYRDIDSLRAAGARIEGEAGLGYTMTEDPALPPQTFTQIEIEALTLGLADVAQRGDPDLSEAADDALPDLCNPAPDPAPFDETCTAEVAAQLIVQPDPQTEPGADMALIRVSQQLPNISPVPFNVCYEPTLAPNPSGPPGSCTDTDPGDTAETLFALVGYGSTTDYTERAPIVPTNPLAGFGGAIYLVADASGTRGCPRFTDLAASEQACLPILAMFPSPPPSDNIQPQLEAGHRTTLFINGAFGLSGDDAMSFGPSMFMWQDNFVAE